MKSDVKNNAMILKNVAKIHGKMTTTTTTMTTTMLATKTSDCTILVLEWARITAFVHALLKCKIVHD